MINIYYRIILLFGGIALYFQGNSQQIEPIAEIPMNYVQYVPGATRPGIFQDGQLYRYHFRMMMDGSLTYQLFMYHQNEDEKIEEWRFNEILPDTLINYSKIVQLAFKTQNEAVLLLSGNNLKKVPTPARIVSVTKTGKEFQTKILGEIKSNCKNCSLLISSESETIRALEFSFSNSVNSITVWKTSDLSSKMMSESKIVLKDQSAADLIKSVRDKNLYTMDETGNLYFVSKNQLKKVVALDGSTVAIVNLPEFSKDEDNKDVSPIWESLPLGFSGNNLIVITKRQVQSRGKDKIIPILSKVY